MIEQILYQRGYYLTLLILMMIGVSARITQWLVLRRLMKAARNAADTKHVLIKQMKTGYTNADKLGYRVRNTKAFIEKYLYRYHVAGMRLDLWSSLTQKAMLLGSAACLLQVFYELEKKAQPLCYVYAAGGCVLLVTLLQLSDSIFPVYDKQRQVILLMQDYFDNHVESKLKEQQNLRQARNQRKQQVKVFRSESAELEQKNEEKRELAERFHTVSAEKGQKSAETKKETEQASAATAATQQTDEKGAQEKLVEDIIREFLT